MAPTIFATYPTNVIQYSRLNFGIMCVLFLPEMTQQGAILLYLIYLKQIYK